MDKKMKTAIVNAHRQGHLTPDQVDRFFRLNEQMRHNCLALINSVREGVHEQEMIDQYFEGDLQTQVFAGLLRRWNQV